MDPIRKVPADRWRGSARQAVSDTLVVEEPLEIRLRGTSVAVTMRTPGHDFDLAAGFLFTEGVLSSPRQVGAIAYCDDPGNPNRSNIVDILPADGVRPPDKGWQRSFYATSSCGICGKGSIEAVRGSVPPLGDATVFDVDQLYEMPGILRSSQTLFSQTGALHGAALFTPAGEMEILREDVGRHNAVDKVIGSRFLAESLPIGGRVLLVSGRASFEITQKALMAGTPAVAALSGASTLAVDLAREAGMLLIGFLRERSMQVYAGWDRLRGSRK